jgi:AraC-like DNA-binding protein
MGTKESSAAAASSGGGGATVSCKTVRAAVLVAKTAGLDVPALLTRQNVSPDQIADPDARFSHDVWLGLWRDIDACGPEPFGLRAAQALPAGHFDVIDYVFAASENLRAGLATFARYFAIVSTGATHTLVNDPDGGSGARLERRYGAGAHTTIGHPAEFALACIVHRSRQMLGVPWRPREVHFAHEKPKDDREHRELFHCPIHFDAPLTTLSIDGSALDLPMTRSEPELRRVLERHADAIVAGLPSTTTDLRARTKEAILEGLRTGATSVSEIAKRLGMSDRTLQRRLGELDTSHARLLDESRSELAVRYLGEPSIAIAEVAFLLGFTDVSAFHRAFRRWTDRTPAEHRRSAREQSL